MPSKQELRNFIRDNLEMISQRLNAVLRGEEIRAMESTLARIGHAGHVPHWYEQLRDNGTLPNLDGKTVGSVVEMLLVGVLESMAVGNEKFPQQRIKPARGIDLPDLDLGVKSPSENYCTSEPFFSAYERLLGSEFDTAVFLTDYQSAKGNPPLQLQIIKWRYLNGSQVADKKLCKLAKQEREWLLQEDDTWFQKLVQFLAFVNQRDWLAKRLLKFIPIMRNRPAVEAQIDAATADFNSKNEDAAETGKEPISDDDLVAIQRIARIDPIQAGVVGALDSWIVQTFKDAARLPNTNELARLRTGPLDGAIGMSFAPQWRYNFGALFRVKKVRPTKKRRPSG